MTELLKLDIGGGDRPKEGHVNVDWLPEADVRLDLEKVGRGAPLPFKNDSVSHVYSSHCWEHLDPYAGLLHELQRVCIMGAVVEIRVPHWGHPMAMCGGHKHVLSEIQMEHWNHYHEHWWPGCEKYFSLPYRTEYVWDDRFRKEIVALHPGWTEEQIFRYVPGSCHEIGFHMKVELKP